MATTLDERRQKTNPRPGVAMDLATVDGAAPLNLTRPGTMQPDAPAAVPTQPAPQFTRTNAGPLLAEPPAAPPRPMPPQGVEVSRFGTPTALLPERTQQLTNQSAAYVAGAQAQPRPAAAAAPAAPRPVAQELAQTPAQPLDAQAAADARMFGQVWDATKGGFQRAGAAIADVATMPVRAAAGAYDTAVIRPMRAAGIPAGYMSPLVNPESNASGQSMTPFYDQIRARDQAAQAGADYGNEGRRTAVPAAAAAVPAAAPMGNRTTLEAQAKNPASDQGQVPGAAAPMPQGAQPAGPANDFTATKVPGVYRKGNTFTDEAGTRDTAFLNRGAITPQNQNAAEQLAANYNSNQQALARLQANNAAAQPRGFAPQQQPRQFDRAASIKAMTDLTSPEYRALRALRMEAESEAKDNARLGRAGRGNNAAGQAYAALMGELTTGTRQGQVAEMQDGTNRYTADRREEGATQRALMGEEGATRRAGMTNEVQQGELGLKREAQNITRERDQRLRKAEDDFLNETDPAKREAKARTLQALMGKGDGTPAGKDRYITMGGGQAPGPEGRIITLPQEVFDTVTGQRVGAAKGGTGDIATDPMALAIKNDTKLTREQKAAQLKQLGY